jgi:hypothetical protein
LFAFLAGAGAIASAAFAGVDGPPTLAAAHFDFRDTSGEVRDQTAEHQARLKAFEATLHDGLSGNQKIEFKALTCQAEPCTAQAPGLVALATQAKTAGVKYLLFGEIHKMSTLIGWVKFAVLDLNDDKPVCDRFMTYRGDTDEAWQHAASFTVRDIEQNCFP